jgi:hypothetical protein
VVGRATWKPFGSESTTYGASVPGARIGDDPRLAVVEVDRVLVLVEPNPAFSGPVRAFHIVPSGCGWRASGTSPGKFQPWKLPATRIAAIPGSGPPGMKIRKSTSPPVGSSPTCRAPQHSAMYRIDPTNRRPRPAAEYVHIGTSCVQPCCVQRPTAGHTGDHRSPFGSGRRSHCPRDEDPSVTTGSPHPVIRASG